MRRKILCLLAALACLPSWAQDIPELNEIVVTATRVDTGVLESPSAITVITQQDIAASGAKDVAGVINGQTGVVVNDNGTAGATQSVSLRGSTSSQVLVLLDGIRLNSSRDGMVDLSSIPMELIDRIEIVRGGASALYGTSAIGGVINVITKKAEKAALTLSITNGSYIPHAANSVDEVFQTFPLPPLYPQTPVAANPLDLIDSQRVDLSLAGKLGDVGLTGGASFSRAANAFTWNDTSHINDWRRRMNADAQSGSANVGINAPLFDGQLGFKGVLDLSETGVPGSLTMISQTARQTNSSASGSLSWKTDRFFMDVLTFDMKAFYRYNELTFNDPLYPPESMHRTNTASLDVTQKLTFSELVSAIYGVSASYDSADSTNYSSPTDRLNIAGFLSVPVMWFEILTITPSIRYDYFSDFAGSLSYSLSTVLLLSELSALRASFGSSYRLPTLNDLYWYDPFGYTAANPNLKPETSYDGEIGWSLARKAFSIDASVFTRLVLNNIIWLSSPPTFVYQPENLTRTLFPGAEIHGKFMITDAISLEASYTFLYSFLLNDGTTNLSLADNRRVPYAPMHSVSAQARYAGKRHVFGGEVRYVSTQYTDRANTEATALSGYFIANADYRFAASENVALTLAAKNIFNSLYYTQAGYPMPPFSIETGVSLHL